MHSLWSVSFLPYLRTVGLPQCSLPSRKWYCIVLCKSAAFLCFIWQDATEPHIWDFFWWMDGGRIKKFYFYLKYILEILIVFFPLPSLCFRLFPLLGFLLFPPRPSAIRCKSYTHSFWSSLKSHFFEAFASCVLFLSSGFFLFSSLLSLSRSARWLTSSFLHSGWKLLLGRSPLEMLGGGGREVAPSARPSSRLNQGVETRPPTPHPHPRSWPLFRQDFLSILFLAVLLDMDTSPFSSDNEQNQKMLGFRETCCLIL